MGSPHSHPNSLVDLSTTIVRSFKMFKLALIAAFIAVAAAQGYGHGGYGGPGPVYGGQGSSYGGHDDYAQPIPYHYGYDIVGGDHHSGDFKQTRQEQGDGHGNVQGSYSYTDAHGNQRHVEYVADGHGFRAQIKTNEPGTENQSPADVHLQAEPPRYQHAPAYGGGAGYGAGPSHGGY